MTFGQTTRHRRLWIGLLLGGSLALSLGSACVTPFAALAALAALTLPRNEALLAVGGVWLVNQAVGFGWLNYPPSGECVAWGIALGIGIMLAVLAARQAAARFAGAGKVAAGAAGFLAAFAAHQLFLFAVAATLLGGTGAFAPAIVGQVLAVNAAAFVALGALGALGETRRTLLAAATGRVGTARRRATSPT